MDKPRHDSTGDTQRRPIIEQRRQSMAFRIAFWMSVLFVALVIFSTVYGALSKNENWLSGDWNAALASISALFSLVVTIWQSKESGDWANRVERHLESQASSSLRLADLGEKEHRDKKLVKLQEIGRRVEGEAIDALKDHAQRVKEARAAFVTVQTQIKVAKDGERQAVTSGIDSIAALLKEEVTGLRAVHQQAAFGSYEIAEVLEFRNNSPQIALTEFEKIIGKCRNRVAAQLGVFRSEGKSEILRAGMKLGVEKPESESIASEFEARINKIILRELK